jgi:RND family efflux transporter MFP subunit
MNKNKRYLRIEWYSWLLTLPMLAQAQDFGPTLVKVAIARVQSLSSVVQVPGTVVSRDDARLSAEIDGRLLTVADVGAKVEAGDPVAVIEDAALRLRSQELQAEIRRAEARMEFLANEVSRFATLAKSDLASANQLEQARSEQAVAQGDLDVAKARLAQNNDQLARSRLLAPFDGVVVERMLQPGERVVDGGVVVRLVGQHRLEVVARAPLEFFAFSHPGEFLRLRAGEQELQAAIRTVVAVGDENTHQFELRLDLVGQPFQVGQTVRLAVPSSAAHEVLTVPRDAVVLRPEGASVFVIDAQLQARQVEVRTGLGSDDYIEISGGIGAGDRVVIRGNERLQAGQSVQILDN